MRQVIDGKRYDTEQAIEIHHWHNGRLPGDFRQREKTLYRTRKGAWFIHHEGGAMTDMAVPVGSNGACGSEKIEPIDENDAYAFLESHDGLAAIEEHFADRIEDA